MKKTLLSAALVASGVFAATGAMAARVIYNLAICAPCAPDPGTRCRCAA